MIKGQLEHFGRPVYSAVYVEEANWKAEIVQLARPGATGNQPDRLPPSRTAKLSSTRLRLKNGRIVMAAEGPIDGMSLNKGERRIGAPGFKVGMRVRAPHNGEHACLLKGTTVRPLAKGLSSMEANTRSNVFLYGYFGAGNLGDDLLLAVTIGALRPMLPQARFIVRDHGDTTGLSALDPGHHIHRQRDHPGRPNGIAPCKARKISARLRARISRVSVARLRRRHAVP